MPELDDPPNIQGVSKAIDKLKSGKLLATNIYQLKPLRVANQVSSYHCTGHCSPVGKKGRSDGRLLNISRFRSRTKIRKVTIRELDLLFADFDDAAVTS